MLFKLVSGNGAGFHTKTAWPLHILRLVLVWSCETENLPVYGSKLKAFATKLVNAVAPDE